MSAAVSEAVAKALTALNRVLPVSVTETPDYAELSFGESKTQAMTLEPETWLALNELPAILAALQEGSGALPASPSGGQWQPIETAPREIEFRCLLAHEFSVITGYWDGEKWVNERSRHPFYSYPATHWMPLPDAPSMGILRQQNETQPSRSDVLERIRAFDFKASYAEAEYKRLADDLEALAQPNQPKDREEG